MCRNFFGSQVKSSERTLNIKSYDLFAFGLQATRAVLIRAPVIVRASPDVTVLATVYAEPATANAGEVLGSLDAKDAEWCASKTGLGWEVAVAVRQRHILGTSFHPEFSRDDLRWHRYFIDMVHSGNKGEEGL